MEGFVEFVVYTGLVFVSIYLNPSLIIARTFRVALSELIVAKADACDFVENAPIPGVFVRVESIDELLSLCDRIYHGFAVCHCLVAVLQILVSNHIAMAVVDSFALSRKQRLFVKKARDAIHLYHMLNILLLPQSGKGELELPIILGSVAKVIRAHAASSKTAAQLEKDAEEQVTAVSAFELAATSYLFFILGFGILSVLCRSTLSWDVSFSIQGLQH